MELLRDEAAVDICVPYLDGQHKKRFQTKTKMYFQQKFITFLDPGGASWVLVVSAVLFRLGGESLEPRRLIEMEPQEATTINKCSPQAFSLQVVSAEHILRGRKLAMKINKKKRMDKDINNLSQSAGQTQNTPWKSARALLSQKKAKRKWN